MLVVTRRSSDKISFPQLGITIYFVRVQGGSAKVGIDAPRDIRIVRDEVAGDPTASARLREQWSRLPKEVRHDIRNELHAISVGLHLYKEQFKAGTKEDAAETFQEIQAAIRRLDENEVLQKLQNDKPPALPGTVLIVEDQENEREMLAGFLRLQGYSAVALQDGDEALSYLESNASPSAVLVDMKMPRCNGSDMVRMLRGNERHSGIRVFASAAQRLRTTT